MKDIEYQVFGSAFALCAAILFCGAIPWYVVRHVGPGKPPPLPTGRVSIAGFGLVDVIGVSLFFGFYTLTLLGKRAMETGAGEQAAGSESLDAAKEAAGALDAEALFGALLSQGFFVVIVVGLLCWRMNLVKAWGIRWRQWPWVFLLVPVALILIYGLQTALFGAGYLEWIAELTGKDPEKPSQESVQILQESGDPLKLGLMTLLACAGAPLMEEIVFRGYIYTAVKRFSNIGVAVFFSGLLFGAVHLDLAGFLPLTVLGMILALLYERTGSLWMPLAVHFAFNSITVGLQYLDRLLPGTLREAAEDAAIIWIW